MSFSGFKKSESQFSWDDHKRSQVWCPQEPTIFYCNISKVQCQYHTKLSTLYNYRQTLMQHKVCGVMFIVTSSYFHFCFTELDMNSLAFSSGRSFYRKLVDSAKHDHHYWAPMCTGIYSYSNDIYKEVIQVK